MGGFAGACVRNFPMRGSSRLICARRFDRIHLSSSNDRETRQPSYWNSILI
mgnify:CR=1 FL=1